MAVAANKRVRKEASEVRNFLRGFALETRG